MKKYLIVLMISFSVVHFSYAQVEKGYNLVGGSANIGMDSDQFSFALTPDLGWFVIDKLAVGGQVHIYVSDDDNYTSLYFSLMPFARYYCGESKTKFFVHGGIGFGTASSWYNFNGNKEKDSDTEFNYDLRAGIAYFIVDQVALEGALVYRKYGITDLLYGNLEIDVGLQIHIFRLFNKNKE